MKEKLRLVVITIKAVIYWQLLMVMLRMSEDEPVLLSALVDMVDKMEVPDEED